MMSTIYTYIFTVKVLLLGALGMVSGSQLTTNNTPTLYGIHHFVSASNHIQASPAKEKAHTLNFIEAIEIEEDEESTKKHLTFNWSGAANINAHIHRFSTLFSKEKAPLYNLNFTYPHVVHALFIAVCVYRL